ncbi:aminotransferase class I/II-fold pyridoxal phosphate-dependent enzyme [Nostoc ellipsosporum NOK]|nr:aminotransferase class I/II-fold pyridoxal phosphate-dependent enzyme [Nostoc ellipsosporum NOK]
MKTSNRLEGIGEYYFSQKLREIEALNAQGRQVINLGIGSPDLPPHPEVIKVLQEASARPDTHAYQSYKGSPVLRKAMSDWYRRHYNVELNPDTEILPLIGSKEGIMHICMTYLEPGDEALVPNPGYPTYRSAVQLAGGRCLDYLLLEENDYYPDLNELASRDLSKVKLMFVNYPHMPTGQPASRASFEQLIAFAAAHDILLVHDNPYSFILNEEPQSLLGIPGAKEQVIELNSLSKSHNMAGWRIGMLCGGADRINEVLRFKSNMDSGMFLPLQLAAARALELGDEWQQELNAVYSSRRKKVFELLQQLDCTFSTTQTGMFVWASIPQQYQTGFQLSDEILQRAAVFITPGGIFGSAGDAYIRVSLCAPVQKFEEALNRISHAQ